MLTLERYASDNCTFSTSETIRILDMDRATAELLVEELNKQDPTYCNNKGYEDYYRLGELDEIKQDSIDGIEELAKGILQWEGNL
jgi:hypothetical protein